MKKKKKKTLHHREKEVPPRGRGPAYGGAPPQIPSPPPETRRDEPEPGPMETGEPGNPSY